jgi:hypothetical protein
MSSQPYFIHFGCWNNGGCPKDNDLTKVLRAIKERAPPPQFLSICGDNYYPKKTKDKDGNKQKFYEYANLLSGFQCLPADLPIYMTYGNHDFETNLYIAAEKETTCTLTRQEQTLVKEQFPNIRLQLFQSAVFEKNTQLLFLDTTVYDPDDIDEYISCYRAVHPSYVDIDAVKQAQLQFIRTFVASISPDVTNIVIVGHHPLAQYKEKKEKIKFFVLNEDFNDLLFEEIFTPLKGRPNNMQYYYLCADLHQYQCGNILIRNEMPIRQYIVGTGGAEKDAYHLTAARTNAADNLQYSMTEEDVAQSCAENGYLTCTAVGAGADLEFAFVSTSLVGGKKTTKRRRRPRKRSSSRKNKSRRTRRK